MAAPVVRGAFPAPEDSSVGLLALWSGTHLDRGDGGPSSRPTEWKGRSGGGAPGTAPEATRAR